MLTFKEITDILSPRMGEILERIAEHMDVKPHILTQARSPNSPYYGLLSKRLGHWQAAALIVAREQRGQLDALISRLEKEPG